MATKTGAASEKLRLERALRAMFRALEIRPMPDSLRVVFDELDARADHDDLKTGG